jgi:hypothetical protein
MVQFLNRQFNLLDVQIKKRMGITLILFLKLLNW